MKKSNLYVLLALIALASCSSGVNRKLLIMGRGGISATGNDITMQDGSGYVEQTVDVNGDKAADWNVQTSAGKTVVNIPAEKGLYILNLKTDTIVGSLQNFKSDLSGGTMTQEALKVKIDSLVKLTTGSNVSDGGQNYFILPNQLKKISANMDAKVYGPFTKIPGSIETDKDGKVPEIYKFYTNTEMRELIDRLKKLTI